MVRGRFKERDVCAVLKEESSFSRQMREKGILGGGTAKAKAWRLRCVGVYNTSGPSLGLKHVERCVGEGKSEKMGALA